MSRFAGLALVDGVETSLDHASLKVTDAGVSRGDGAFETIGVWDGRPFRLKDHLRRLNRSLAALCLPPAPLEKIRQECDLATEAISQDAALRVYLTASGTRILTLSPPPEQAVLKVLIPQPAPWIQPPQTYQPAGAKSMSYGPNMAAGRLARQAGGDDALLFSVPDKLLLEGPTFGVVFVAQGVIHAPAAALGIVDSISRLTLLDIARHHGLDVLTGQWPLDVLAEADEVITSSSLRPATAVQRIGGWTYARHPVADLLDKELRAKRRHRSAT